MSYWRIFFTLFLILVIGIFLVAGNLNQQLCCEAAPILDLKLSGESARLSVLNASFSVGVPSVFQQLSQVLVEGSLKDVNGVTPQIPKPGQEVRWVFSKAKPVVSRLQRAMEEAKVVIQPVVGRAQPKIKAFTERLWQGARSFGQRAEGVAQEILDRLEKKQGQGEAY